MNNSQEPRSRRRRRSGSGRKARKMDAASLVHFLRRHGTLTLLVCVAFVSLATSYVAIDLSA